MLAMALDGTFHKNNEKGSHIRNIDIFRTPSAFSRVYNNIECFVILSHHKYSTFFLNYGTLPSKPL